METLDDAMSITRPSIHPVVSWIDFLLNDNLLAQHLSEEKPDPSACELVIQFLSSANAVPPSGQNNNNGSSTPSTVIALDGANIDSGKCSPEEDTTVKKLLPLKLLALKTAAFLGWNLDVLENKLPISMQHMLIEELQRAAGCGELENEAKLTNPDAAFAHILKCRWTLRTAIRSRVPVRGQKGLAVQIPGQVDPTQVPPEMLESLTKKCEEESTSAADWLEVLLGRKVPVRIPTVASFRVIKSDVIDQTHDWHNGIPAAQDDISCQVSYELACFNFFKERYQHASQLFEAALSLYPKVKKRVVTHLDIESLKGYCLACRTSAATKRSMSLLDKLKASVASNFKGVVSILLEDNVKREIPLYEREAVELRAEQQLGPNLDIPTQISLCNSIRRVISGDTFVTGMQVNFAAMDKGCIIVLNEALHAVVPSLNEKEMRYLRNFVGYICNMSPDIAKTLTCSGVIRKYFPMEEVVPPNELPPKIPADKLSFSENVATNTVRMERALIASHDPDEIVSLIKYLQNMTPPVKLPSLNSHWKLARSLRDFHRGLPPQWQDRMYVLLAKALELRALKLYCASLVLLRTIEAELMPQWRRLASILLSEIRHTEMLQAAANIQTLYQNSARRSEVVDIARTAVLAYYKESEKGDFSPNQDMAEICCVTLLNLQEWDAIPEADKPLRGIAGFLELTQTVAAVCKDVYQNRFTRSVAQDLWDLVLSMFAVNSTSSQHKRTGSGTVKENFQREVVLSRNTFHSFLQNLKENLALTILLSCLVKLYNILKDDCSTDVSLEHQQLWPVVVTNSSCYCRSTLTDVLQTTLQHAISTNSSHAVWVKMMADFCYARNHYSAALKHYLTAILMSTDYFAQSPPRTLGGDPMYKRMAHCCTKLQCHTQAALLCQLMDEPDYSAAFKSLNERQSQDSCDSLYEHICDVTLLEFLVNLHARRGDVDSKQKALRCLGQLELNTNNNEEIQREAAAVRRGAFLRIMAKQYL
ncbi:integrator complex subunit 8-like [Ornithodoros turicata]|uniref:integrator complex subunit 8-like n=1 Tax=Ornithodoros turicata TaxID=34597 RepID=UPI0031390BBF